MALVKVMVKKMATETFSWNSYKENPNARRVATCTHICMCDVYLRTSKIMI